MVSRDWIFAFIRHLCFGNKWHTTHFKLLECKSYSSKLNENWNETKKKKYLNLKNFVFQTLSLSLSLSLWLSVSLSHKFAQITLKFAKLYLFHPLFLVSLYKIPFYDSVVYYLFESVSELENCGTYRLKLHTKALKNITLLNIKFGFSINFFILNFVLMV